MSLDNAPSGTPIYVFSADTADGYLRVPANALATAQGRYIVVNPTGDGLTFAPKPGFSTQLALLTDVEMPSSIPDGSVLRYTDGVWQPEAGLDGGVIARRNGLALTQTLGDINFVGQGVTVSSNGDAVTVEIAGYTPPAIVAAGKVIGPYRYWRLLVSATAQGQRCSITELQMFDGRGVNACTGPQGATWSSSADSNSTGDKAFDNNTATFWRSGTADYGQQYLAYDFGTPEAIEQFSILSTSYAGEAPQAFVLQYSSDNANWSTAYVGSQTSWPVNTTYTFGVQDFFVQNFLNLGDTPKAYSTAGLLVGINATQDGLSFIQPEVVGRLTLATLNDVSIGTPTQGQVLTFESDGHGGGVWSPVTPPVADIQYLSQLLDVEESTTPPQAGQVLTFINGKWTPGNPSAAGVSTLRGLTDVSVPANPADGIILTYDAQLSIWRGLPGKNNLYQLNDVEMGSPGPLDGEILQHVDGLWQPVPLDVAILPDGPGAPSALKALQLVRVRADGKALEYSAPPFIPTRIAQLSDVEYPSAPIEQGAVLTYIDGLWQPEMPAEVAGSTTKPDFGAHLYWRLAFNQYAPSQSHIDVAELAFRAVAGGPNLATGGTPFGENAYSGYPYSQAFDGNLNTVCGNGGVNLPLMIGYQFASAVDVAEVTLTCGSSANAPYAFDVQFSDDGSTYTTGWSVTGETAWAAQETRAYDPTAYIGTFTSLSDVPHGYGGQANKILAVKSDETGLHLVEPTLAGDSDVAIVTPTDGQVLTYDADSLTWKNVTPTSLDSEAVKYGAHRYWRLHETQPTSQGALAIAEMVFAATAGGAQQATGGAAVASSTFGGYPASNAFDGSATTFWSSNGISNGVTLEYQFSGAVNVEEVRITARNDATLYDQGPTTFNIEYSDDDENWHIAWTVYAASWVSPGQSQTFSAPTTASVQVALSSLTDVDESTAPTDGQVLTYSGAEAKWKAQSPSTAAGSATLAGLSDVDETTAPTQGQVLTYSASEQRWRPQAPPTSQTGASTACFYGVGAPSATGPTNPIAPHSYWRIDSLTSGDGSYASVGELAFAASQGGASLCTGGTPIASSSTAGSYPAANAFDGDSTTLWAATLPTAYLAYAFANPVAVSEVRITPRTDNTQNLNQTPSTFTLSYSDDGSTWTSAQSFSAVWSTQSTQSFENTSNHITYANGDLYFDTSVTPFTEYTYYGGWVEVAGAAGASTLAALTDVDETTAPTNGQALVYSASEQKWKPETISAAQAGAIPVAGECVWTPPSAGAFSHQNFGSNTTVTTPKIGGVRLSDLGSNGNINNHRMMLQPIAGAQWRATARVRRQNPWINYQAGGLSVRDSVSGKSYLFGLSNDVGGLGLIRWNSDGGYGQTSSCGGGESDRQTDLWLRVAFDGSNFAFSVSQDGDDFNTVFTESTADLFAGSATHVGFGINANSNGASSQITYDFLSWEHVTAAVAATLTPQAAPQLGAVGIVTTVLHKSTAQATPNDGSWVVASWDTVVHDELATFSSTNPGRITVPPGVTRARFTGYTSWPNAGGGARYMALVKNGSDQTADCVQAGVNAHANESDFGLVSQWLDVAPGDYFQLMVADASDGVALQGDEVGAGFGSGSYFQAEFAAVLSATGGLTSLASLVDVDEATTPTDGQVLTYVGAENKWKAKTPSSSGGSGSSTLAGLSDIDETTAPTDGQVLAYSASEQKWKPETVASSGSGASSSAIALIPGFAPPAPSLFPTLLGTSATPTLVIDEMGLVLNGGTPPAASTQDISLALKPVPSGASWTATIKIASSMIDQDYLATSFYLHEASSGKIVAFGWTGGVGIEVVHYSSLSAYTSTPYSKAMVTRDRFLRIVCDGSNYQFQVSSNLTDFYQIYSESMTAFFGTAADTIGFGLNAQNNFDSSQLNGICSATCSYYSDSSTPAVHSITGASLSALSDIDETTAPTDGQVLTYSASEQKWKPETPATSGSAGASSAIYSLGPPSASHDHKYWRIDSFNDADGSYISIAELSLAASTGGADLCTGGSAIESGHCFSYVAANAFDGTPSSIWAQTPLAGAWVGYQFAQPVFVAEVKITPRTDAGGSTDVAQSPTTFQLSYSDDGVNWTGVQTFSPGSWSSLTPQTFEQTVLGASTSYAEGQVYYDTTSAPYAEYLYHNSAWVAVSAAKLTGLGDIDGLTVPADGQVLTYSAAESKWKPQTPAAGSGGSTGSTTTSIGGYTSDTYWDLVNAGGDFSSDATGRVITSENPSSWHTVRANKSRASGKVYYEVKIGATNNNDPMVGVTTAQASVQTYVGGDAFGWGQITSGATYTNGGTSGTSGSSRTTGDVIGVSIDFTAGTIAFYKNGTVNGGFSGLTLNSPLFPSIGGYANSTGIAAFNAADMLYLPAGFAAWGDPVSAGSGGSGSSTLAGLSDVDETTAPTDGQVLTYSASEQKWKAEAPAAAGDTALAALSDVDETTAPIDGQVLTYSASEQKWKPEAISVPPAPVGAHKFWRVMMLYSYGNGNIGLSNVEFRTVAGTVQQATGGTVLESDTLGGYPGANAFDGDPTNSFWASNSIGFNTYIGYEFATAIPVAELALTNRTGNYGDGPPKEFLIQCSDDGALWNTVAEITAAANWADGAQRLFEVPASYVTAVSTASGGSGATTLAALSDIDETTAPSNGQVLTYSTSEQKWKPQTIASSAGGSSTLAGLSDIDETTAPTDGQVLAYSASEQKWKPETVASSGGGSTDVPTTYGVGSPLNGGAPSHTYWRITNKASAGANGWVGIAKLTMAASAGGADQCTGGTAFETQGYDALQGGGSSFQPAYAFDSDPGSFWASGASPSTLGYQFASPVAVAELTMQNRPAGHGVEAPSDFTLDFSDDGATYTTLQEFTTSASWGDGEVRTFDISSGGVPIAGTEGERYIQTGCTPWREWVYHNGLWSPLGLTITAPNTYTANYTQTTTDDEQLALFNASTAVTYTIESNATVPCAPGHELSAMQLGSGAVSFVAASGVTLLYAAGLTPATRTQYSMITAVQIAADTWVVAGDMASSS